eukprot:c12186_g1_i2.p1 GENE.c12186_g1_i2~~c12186_g1_i2.p1  ORF type:complete len:241 (-),score=95.83 c12186_g1_i2:506-1228(-)
MSQAKRAKTEDNNGNTEIDAKMEQLGAIQEKIEELNNQCMEAIVEIEKKYNELKRPHFNLRAESIRDIPQFWAITLQSHPTFSQLIEQDDMDALQHLTHVDVEDKPDVKSGFTINFTFSENAFFENKTISKTVSYDDEGAMTIQNTEINWKSGKDLTKSKNVQGAGKRDDADSTSFFEWFSDDSDATLSEALREEIWPNPVKYFCGTFSDDDDEAGDDDGDDDDDDDDDDGEVNLDNDDN